MTNAPPVAHLLVPGLRGPLPPETRDSDLWQRRLPAFERLFARGRTEERPTQHFYEQLRELFQLPGRELPAGALGWLGEGRDPGTSIWLRADPVHFRPDRDQLMLFDASALEVQPEEAAALVDRCNRLLAEDGLELHAATPERWYLRAKGSAELETMPASVVAGRYLQDYLPRGAAASRWLSLATELQMLLHQAPENERREDAGKLTINGVWFWGAGALPVTAGGDWRTIIADEPVVRGLASVAGITAQPLSGELDQLPMAGRCLIVETRLAEALRSGDPQRWRQALDALEQHLLQPLLHRLQAGEIAALIIDTERLRLRVSRRDLARFWRRPQPLRHYLEF